ncbi:MAG: type IX secretion system sortase PorU [Flavobacterium sp.]
MKRILTLIIVLLFCLANAQQGDVTLVWRDGHKTWVGQHSFTIPAFQNGNMAFDAEGGRLTYKLNQPAAGPVNQQSLVISNITYQTITRQQLGDLQVQNLPSAINAKITGVRSRNDWHALITLSPIIKEGAAYRRVVSFSYSYSLQTSGVVPRSVSDFNVISNSVLASGSWSRFYVERSGIYKVSRSFLQQLGVNVNADPRNIKIYGNGGRMLPLLNAVPYPADLEENAIAFIGEEDGVFNDQDYILFYAEGVDNWNAENGTHNNLYADRSYYYVNTEGGPGKRMAPVTEPAGAPTVTVSAFDEYVYHERDRVNIARLGRKWHGEEFNINDEQEFKFTLPDLDSQTVQVKVCAAADAAGPTTMDVKVNGQQAGALTFGVPGQYDAAREAVFSGNASVSGSEAEVTLKYNNGGVPSANAWLDYIVLQAKRKLRGNGKQFRFRYNDAVNNIGVVQYQFSAAEGIAEVWDITDIYNAGKISNTAGQGSFAFKAAMGEARQYITYVPADVYTPLREGNPRVANQNLKGTIFRGQGSQFQDVDYLIITPEYLRAPAERLATFHRGDSGLKVKVVSLENIYQEFGGGKQDIGAIRNFIKYVYNNASAVANRVKYVNLFGDASFDFKNRIPNNTNIVPTFHALDTNNNLNFSEVSTFMSDDFFGLMDDTEGVMTIGVGNEGPDIAVGRMLVTTNAIADQMVNKVLEYKAEESYGRWRNEYVVVSDDIDADSDARFVPVMDELVDLLVANRPFINVRKIYTDAYVQQVTSGGERYPEAKDQIIRSLNSGTLVLNYLGHGGESGMASEAIFGMVDAQNLNNKHKYPLFITATCDLTKFDNPYRQTTGEFLYWNTNGGAISLITTTRAIFINDAFDFNTDLSTRLYSFNGGDYPSMAEAMRLTKAANGAVGFRVVAFVGDPALKLAIPKPKIVLTEINGQPAGGGTAVLEALSHTTMKGQVTDEAGNVLNGYNGELAVLVFDKPVNRQTLNNDGASIITGYTPGPQPVPIYGPAVYNFTVLGETIFRGNATVSNGQFQFGFVVPRDIRIPVAAGRVSFYAKRNGVLEDQAGFDTTVQIGGLDETAAVDNTGPRVKLYMNDTSFISGGITNESPIFLAFLEDENGINTASGIGHDIVAILDGDEANPYILNDYYETELDDYTKGNIRYPFTNLAPGLHTILFKAWDVYNNLVTAEIQFVVVGDENMHIEKVLNYPNPFVSYTEFWFTHNRPFEPLDVQVQVFTVTGKVVRTINQSVVTDGFLSRDIKWDGKDDFGDKIGKGVYVYKLTVRSTISGKTAEKYEKLVLL